MMKIIITENQFKNLILEQTVSLPVTVNGSFISYDGDSAHNFKELELKLDVLLPRIYNSGINPKITNITATITKDKKTFTTTYSATINKSDDGKAWMGFTARGSFGSNCAQRAKGQITGTENVDGRSLEQKLKGIGAGEIEIITVVEDLGVPFTEYFIQFTKPQKYPPQ
jgi:hypothetical protein